MDELADAKARKEKAAERYWLLYGLLKEEQQEETRKQAESKEAIAAQVKSLRAAEKEKEAGRRAELKKKITVLVEVLTAHSRTSAGP